nr:MAG TPA: hypothetical protein [Caudoviricetes sp.]
MLLLYTIIKQKTIYILVDSCKNRGYTFARIIPQIIKPMGNRILERYLNTFGLFIH